MMYLGVEGTLPISRHHTILLARLSRDLKDIEQRQCLPKRPSLYVRNPSRTDPTLAPAGHSVLYVLVPVAHRSATSTGSGEPRRFADSAEADGARSASPTARPNPLRAGLHAAPLGSSTWVYQRATFNLAHSLGQMLHRRPNNRFEDLETSTSSAAGRTPAAACP